MKKLSLLIAIFVVFSLAVINVSAEVNPNGYVFNIKAVNSSHSGEDNILFTTQDAAENGNLKWAISVVLELVETNVYKVKEVITGAGEVPTISLKKNDIVLGAHSSTSKVEMADEYPNVMSKLVAGALEKGMYIKLSGIDLDAMTATDGKATVSKKKPAGDEVDVSEPEDSEAQTSENEESDDISEEESDEESAEESLEPEESSQSESQLEDTSEDVVASQMPIEDSEGMSTTTIILIVAAGVILIAVLAVILGKKKKD